MSYASVTLATLRARLQERYDATPFWSTADANDLINEALRWFNLYTGFWRGTVTIQTIAGSPFLQVSGSLTYRTRVFAAGNQLTPSSIVQLYRARPNWRTQTTASGGSVPTTLNSWAPIGLSTVAIWPADAAGGTTVSIDAVKITPTLTADGQFVDLGTEELDLLLDEALWGLSFKRPSVMAALKPGHIRFLQGCLARNNQLRASSYFREALGLDQEQRLVSPRMVATQGGPGQEGQG